MKFIVFLCRLINRRVLLQLAKYVEMLIIVLCPFSKNKNCEPQFKWIIKNKNSIKVSSFQSIGENKKIKVCTE